MKKNVVKFSLDIALAITLTLLYVTRTLGMAFHEIAGVAICGVFIIHVAFNWKQVVASLAKLFGPGISVRRRLNYIVSIALAITFILILLSGIFISQYLFPGLAMRGGPWRVIHEFCSGLSIILVGLHIGLNWDFIRQLVGRGLELPKAVGRAIGIAALALVVIYGAFNLVTSDFGSLLASPFSGDSRGGFSRGQMPTDFDPGNLPEGFEPGQGFPGGDMGGDLPTIDPNTNPTVDPNTNPTTDPSAVPTPGANDQSGSDQSGNRRGRIRGGESGSGSGQFTPGERPGRSGSGGGSSSSNPVLGALDNVATYGSMIGLFAALSHGLILLIRRNKHKNADYLPYSPSSPTPAPAAPTPVVSPSAEAVPTSTPAESTPAATPTEVDPASTTAVSTEPSTPSADPPVEPPAPSDPPDAPVESVPPAPSDPPEPPAAASQPVIPGPEGNPGSRT
jgi:uncharacterized membrane protein YgcG